MKPSFVRKLGGSLLLSGLLACTAFAQSGDTAEDVQRRASQAQAVVMWVGLGILSVLVLGIGLIWMVSRAARRARRRRGPVHTEMADIWYLNPPEKRKHDNP